MNREQKIAHYLKVRFGIDVTMESTTTCSREQLLQIVDALWDDSAECKVVKQPGQYFVDNSEIGKILKVDNEKNDYPISVQVYYLADGEFTEGFYEYRNEDLDNVLPTTAEHFERIQKLWNETHDRFFGMIADAKKTLP